MVKENILQEIDLLKQKAASELESVTDSSALEAYRIKYLGRKGLITSVLKSLKEVPAAQRPVIGSEINKLKSNLESNIEKLCNTLGQAHVKTRMDLERLDITMPGRRSLIGHRHPLKIVMRDIQTIFSDMGFSIFH